MREDEAATLQWLGGLIGTSDSGLFLLMVAVISLVYFGLGAAVLALSITCNVVATISFIIVAGVSGIAAGTPLAVLGAVGRAARNRCNR